MTIDDQTANIKVFQPLDLGFWSSWSSLFDIRGLLLEDDLDW